MSYSVDTKILLEALTGVKYPAANELKMKAAAGAVRRNAGLVRAFAPQIERLLRSIQDDLNGQTEKAFYLKVAPFAMQEPRVLYKTADGMDNTGKYMDEMALEVDYLKRLMRWMIVFLAIQIAMAFIEMLYNPPGAAARIASAQVVAKVAVTRAAAQTAEDRRLQLRLRGGHRTPGPAGADRAGDPARRTGRQEAVRLGLGATISTLTIIGTALPGAKLLHGGIENLMKNVKLNLSKNNYGWLTNNLNELPVGVGTEVVAELMANGILNGEWTVGWSAATSGAFETVGTAGGGPPAWPAWRCSTNRTG